MKRFLTIILAIVLLMPLTSCSVASNFITTGYLSVFELEDSLYIKSQYLYLYKIDIDDKTFEFVDDSSLEESLIDKSLGFKYEFFAGEYFSTLPEDCEGIETHINKYMTDNDFSSIDASGYVKDNVLLGFIQVYKGTAGQYNNFKVENISHSIIFSYDIEKDEFSILENFDDIVIVAFSNDTIIYWDDKAYYAYDLINDRTSFLVEDKAYDSGLSQLSLGSVFYNENICVIHLIKGEINIDDDVEYMYLFDFTTQEFVELQWLK